MVLTFDGATVKFKRISSFAKETCIKVILLLFKLYILSVMYVLQEEIIDTGRSITLHVKYVTLILRHIMRYRRILRSTVSITLNEKKLLLK